jgi:hypothetical protein
MSRRYNAEYQGVWRANHPEQKVKLRETYRGRWQDYHLKYKYGLTRAEWSRIKKGQNHRCLICRKKTHLVVDHDHKTGLIRGLLCKKCNLMLGMAKDNPITLRAGAGYLEEAQRCD